MSPWGLGLTGDAQAIGEIHHAQPGHDDPELLFKTLFTGERLSIQVHPDCAAAAQMGLKRGKDEAWVVLAVEPGAVIGLGLTDAIDTEALRAAALDGSIVDRLRWHACAPGDVFFTPAGTIHAIGAGVTLFEIQQNNDITWRLYDYGRGRGLHIDAALAVAATTAWVPPPVNASPGPGRELLVEGPGFVLERWKLSGAGMVHPRAGRPVWMAIIDNLASLGNQKTLPGEVWFTDVPVAVAGDATVLVAYPGAGVINDIWRT